MKFFVFYPRLFHVFITLCRTNNTSFRLMVDKVIKNPEFNKFTLN